MSELQSANSQPRACPECRHIFPNGRRCHAAALRGKPLCYFHSRNRSVADQNRARTHSVALPPLEDRGAIQVALNEVLAALAAGKLDRKEIWPYLSAIQMASRNLALGAAKQQEIVYPSPVEAFEEKFGESLAVSTEPDATPETSPGTPADLCLPRIEAAATHEYDPESPLPEPPPPKPPKPSRWGLFSSRTEMNLFYNAEDAWLRGFTEGQMSPLRLQRPSKTAEEIEAELKSVRKAKKAGLPFTLSPELQELLAGEEP